MAVYYIKNGGSDSNNGTSDATAFATYAKAISVAVSGDTISFKRGGTYTASISLSKSNITVNAYGTGAKPIISGLKTITNWVNVGGGIWESTDSEYPTYLNQVLFNGSFEPKGRWPKQTLDFGGYNTVNSTNGLGTNLTSNSLSGRPNYTGAEVVIRDMNWSLFRNIINSHSGNTLTFNATAYKFKVNHGFFIQNHKSLLTLLGEWSYNASTKTISMYFGSNNPSSYTVQASIIERLVSCTSGSVTNVDVSDLELIGSNQNAVYLWPSGQIDILNCDIKFSGQDGISVQNANYVKVDGCNIHDSLWSGVSFRNDTQNSTITNNNIYNSGIVPGHHYSGNGGGYGIAADWASTLIQYNHVFDSGYAGIRFGQSNSQVKNNWIDNFCLIKDDGSAIYSFRGGGQTIDKNALRQTGKVVYQNIITNGKGNAHGLPTSNEFAEGIYFDDNESGIECSYNFIARVTRRGLFPHNNYEVSIHHNIVFDALFAMEMLENVTGSPMRDMDVYSNTLITMVPRLLLKYFSQYNDLAQFGSSDNNKLINLSSQTKIIQAYNNNVRQGDYILPEWKSTSWPYDKNSTEYKPVIVAGDNVVYDINPSKEVKTVYMGGSFVDHNGTLHDMSGTWVDQDANVIGGTFTLQPYEGKVLFKVSNAEPEPEPDTPPVVSLISPQEGTRIIYDNSLTIQASISSSNPIDKVEFFQGATLIQTLTSAPWETTFVPDAGDHFIQVKATDEDGLEGFSDSVLVEVYDFVENGQIHVKINAGTNLDVTYQGMVYRGDRNFLDLYSDSLEDDVSPVTTETLFLTGRAAPILEYTIPLPNGKYTVKTMHNEPWFGVHVPGGQGKRVFDINLQGQLVKQDFDIFLENNNQNTTLTFDDIEVTDGQLVLLLNNSNNKANISGIEVMPYSDPVEVDYDLEVRENPQGWGTAVDLTNESPYPQGTQVELQATPETWTQFYRWSRDGVTLSTNQNYLYTTRGQNDLVLGEFQPKQYPLVVTVTPIGGGTVNIESGNYTEGQQVPLVATNNTGYTFLNWQRNGEILSTNPSYTHSKTAGNETISAHFTLAKHALTVTAGTGGSATGGGSFAQGETTSLQATAISSYQFDGWYRDNVKISIDNPYTYTARNQPDTVQARFLRKSVAVISADPESGTKPLTVQFSSSGSVADTYAWDFGNGSTSFLALPYTVYQNAGTYTVTLTTKYGELTDTATMEITVTDPVYVPPTVTITSPQNLSVNFEAPAKLPFRVLANSELGITKVEYWVNEELIATVTNAPYSYDWNNVSEGTYSIVAKAFDEQGSTESNPVSVTVYPPSEKYKLNGKELSDFGIIAGRAPNSNISVSGHLDFPKRLGKSFHVWDDEEGVEPYVSYDEIKFEGRDIRFHGYVEGSDKNDVMRKLYAFYDYLNNLNDEVLFSSKWGSWLVIVQSEVEATQIKTGMVSIVVTFRQPDTGIQPIQSGGTADRGIDGINFGDLGFTYMKLKNQWYRPTTKDHHAIGYFTEPFQVTKAGAREMILSGLLETETYQEMVNIVSSLYSLFAKEGVRTLQINNEPFREFFVKDGFEVTNIIVKHGKCMALLSINMMELNKPVFDPDFFTDTDGNYILSNTNQKIIIRK